MSYALSVLLHNGFKEAGITVLAMMAVLSAGVWFQVRWHVHLLMPGDLIASLPAVVSYMVWAGLALAFVASAQVHVERVEPK